MHAQNSHKRRKVEATLKPTKDRGGDGRSGGGDDSHTCADGLPSKAKGAASFREHQLQRKSTTSGNDDWPWVWAIRDGNVLHWKHGLTNEEITAKKQHHKVEYNIPTAIIGIDKNCLLYLGSGRGARNIPKLQELGISAIVNVGGAIARGPVDEYKQAGFDYYEVDAEDEEGYPLLENHFDEVKGFLVQHQQHNQTSRVLIHCQAGVNRSACILAALVLAATTTTENRTMNVLEVVQLIRSKRGNLVLLNDSFQDELVAFARFHKRLGPCPGAKDCIVKVNPTAKQDFTFKWVP